MTKFYLKKGIDGLMRALKDAFIGMVIIILTKGIILSSTDNETYAIIGSIIIFAFSLFILYEKMNYWGIGYTGGWIIGIVIIFYSMSSIISPIEIIINIGIGIFYLIVKSSNKISGGLLYDN